MIRRMLLPLIFIVYAPLLAQEEGGLMGRLLSPGKLTKSHAKIGDCMSCHDASNAVPDNKCLSCHQPIQEQIQSRRGLHGRATQSCRECHSDHKGSDFTPFKLDAGDFNHGQQTGFHLEGKHGKVNCTACHDTKYGAKSAAAGKARYFGKLPACIGCHKGEDVHLFKGEMSKTDCNACHDVRSWKFNVTFDHERDGRFKLEGKHKDLKCAQCHTHDKGGWSAKYEWPNLKTNQCLSCHKDHHQDKPPHQSRGTNCAQCHNQQAWRTDKFNHEFSNFKLTGAHAGLKCVECHTAAAQKSKKGVVKPDRFAGLKPACASCHKDVHQFGRMVVQGLGPLNQCNACHTDKAWEDVKNFDHGTTRFKLDGQHAKVNCKQCHGPSEKKAAVYKWPALGEKTCATCHATPHAREFSKELQSKRCTECHTTAGWQNMVPGKGIDHAQTRFPLTGAHAQVKCSDCHGTRPNQKFKFPSVNTKFCVDCHQDTHQGQFSRRLPSKDCASCHGTDTFKSTLPFDHSRTRFALAGPHKSLDCAKCHKPSGPGATTQFLMPKVTGETCVACHADTHAGQLGTKCMDCHKANTWKPVEFDHGLASSFPLKGKHEAVACNKCHKQGAFAVGGKRVSAVKYKSMDAQCVSCHKDNHRGNFGSKCAQCHTERAWNITRDFHKNFTLTGVHYSVQCSECHKDGRKLTGLSRDCAACHLKDDVHSGTLSNCQECHRQQYWEVSSFQHSMTLFPLRGAHRTLDCMACHRSGTYKGLSNQCSTCHLSDAQSNPTHSPIGNFLNCTDCHKNQFTFR